MDKKDRDKEKKDTSDEKKQMVAPDPKKDKDITLAKRSGQRPALPFKRKSSA